MWGAPKPLVCELLGVKGSAKSHQSFFVVAGASMLCALPGCDIPKTGAVACSEHHFFLLMDSRYSSSRSTLPLLGRKPPHLCAFSSCSHPPSLAHGCCSKRHYLSWLQSAYTSLRRDQICQLPGCFRHVFVELLDDESFKIYDFCGWTHCQQFYIQKALRPCAENSIGHEPSVDSLMECLKDYVRHKNISRGNIQVYEDFFSKHPWEILDRQDVESRWVIARCMWKEKDSSKRELITKDGYHWKQQGKTWSHNTEISKRHLTYTKLGTKKKGSIESNEMAFTMHEYTLVGAGEFKDYCLVKLSRGRVAQNQARKRAKPDDEDQLEDVESNSKQSRLQGVLDGKNNTFQLQITEDGRKHNLLRDPSDFCSFWEGQLEDVESNNKQHSVEIWSQGLLDISNDTFQLQISEDGDLDDLLACDPSDFGSICEGRDPFLSNYGLFKFQ